MKILFLDDDCSRWHTFKQTTIGCDVDWAKNAKEAMGFLALNKYDGIFLDHDLDIQATMGRTPLEATGQDVARFIVDGKSQDKDIIIVVHSLNPDGAKSMASILKQGGYQVALVPFAWKKASYNGSNVVIK